MLPPYIAAEQLHFEVAAWKVLYMGAMKLRKNLSAQEADGLGTAFERLLIPSLLDENNFLLSIVATQIGDAAKQLADYKIPKKSSYGVLAFDASYHADPEGDCAVPVDGKCKAIKATLDWIDSRRECRAAAPRHSYESKPGFQSSHFPC